MKNELNSEDNVVGTKLEETDLDTITGGQSRVLSFPPRLDHDPQLSLDEIPEDLRPKKPGDVMKLTFFND